MNGKIILNDLTDNILENHFVIKGDIKDIEPIEDKLISYQINKYGFNGIIETKNAEHIDARFILERPNIEDIMIGYNYSEGKNDKIL
jgi:ABC-2 type transport system ATP-binding protein